jgi:hypothetical protein
VADGVLTLVEFVIFFCFLAMKELSDYWQTAILIAGGVWLLLYLAVSAAKQVMGVR